jgi:hypothetical protein
VKKKPPFFFVSALGTLDFSMPTSSPLTADTLRIRNKATGRAMWLVTTDEGALTSSEVNPDRGHCPDLLINPVSAPDPAVFITGTPTTATFQFDGELGASSTVAVTNAGVTGSVSAISLAGSMMVFQYTAASGDVLKFTAKSADGSKTARRLFTPATVTLGPAYVADSLTQTVFTDGWPASATLNFDRVVATVGGVTLVSDSGAQAGTLTHSLSGSTLTLTNIITTPATAKIRITGATDGDGFSTAVIDVAITRQAATKPTLTSISLTTFTYGVEAYTDLVFNETLQSFTPTIDGVGATVTTTWTPGQNTARVFVTAAFDSTQLTFQVVDSNDGGADTITSALTILAPAAPILQSISVTTFVTGAAVTGIVATFDRDILSVASLTVTSGGTATVTGISGSQVIFTMTATAAANPGYVFFNNVVSTQNSSPVTRSASFTAAAPTWMTRFTGDVGVVASGGVVTSWTATGSNATTLQALGASDSVLSFNGRSVVKLASTSTYFNAPVPFNHTILFAYFLPPDFQVSPDPILFVFDQSSDKRNGSVNVDESFRGYTTSGRNFIAIQVDSAAGAVWSTHPSAHYAYNSGTWHSLIVSRGTETGVYLDGVMIGKATRGTPQPLYDGRLMTLSAQHASRSANIAILEHGVLAAAVDDAGAAGIHQELVAYWGAQT